MGHRSRGRHNHVPPTNGNGKLRPTVEQRQFNKVAICIPSRGVCDAGFCYDLANMMAWTGMELVQRGMEVSLNFHMSTYVHTNRTELAQRTLKDPTVTHTLWLDDDMRFPKEVMARLLLHHQPFVGANYSHRKPPPEPVAMKRNFHQDHRSRLMTTQESTGLEVVEAIGFGCVLVAREVFEATKYPWFECRWDEDGHRAVGEDVHFCWLAQEAGFPVFVDHDLSKEILHAGQLEYSLDHVNNWEAMRLEQRADREAPQAKPQLVEVG